MSSRSNCPTVAGYRRQAALLLKDFRSDDPARRTAASNRFSRIPRFTANSDLACVGEVRLKHALQVIAMEEGAPDWPALKARTETVETAELLYAGGHLAAYWNIWFARYEEASAVHRERGGFLFPYRSHFFVSDEHFVRAAGLDPEAAEWRQIGFDWAQPANRRAWARLADGLRQHVAGQSS